MTSRPIIATLFLSPDGTRARRSRRYGTPESALSKAVSWLLREGAVHSVVEIADLDSGIQFATARITATGKISLSFTFKEFETK